jgi:hypothetical protein
VLFRSKTVPLFLYRYLQIKTILLLLRIIEQNRSQLKEILRKIIQSVLVI